MTELVARCEVYRESYLTLPSSKAVEQLSQAMTRLYASILSYLAWAMYYFGKSTSSGFGHILDFEDKLISDRKVSQQPTSVERDQDRSYLAENT